MGWLLNRWLVFAMLLGYARGNGWWDFGNAPEPAPVQKAVCWYDRKWYAHGALLYNTPDGCNACSCDDGKINCIPVSKQCGCKYNGEFYKIGEQASSACETCKCVKLDTMNCVQKTCNCVYENNTYLSGTSVLSHDLCTNCTCESGINNCRPVADMCGCHYQGKFFKIGDNSTTGCQTCTCNKHESMDCVRENCNCLYEGNEYKSGQKYFSQDLCKSCYCYLGLQECKVAEQCGCNYQGKFYKIGEQLLGDCVTCTCNKRETMDCIGEEGCTTTIPTTATTTMTTTTALPTTTPAGMAMMKTYADDGNAKGLCKPGEPCPGVGMYAVQPGTECRNYCRCVHNQINIDSSIAFMWLVETCPQGTAWNTAKGPGNCEWRHAVKCEL